MSARAAQEVAQREPAEEVPGGVCRNERLTDRGAERDGGGIRQAARRSIVEALEGLIEVGRGVAVEGDERGAVDLAALEHAGDGRGRDGLVRLHEAVETGRDARGVGGGSADDDERGRPAVRAAVQMERPARPQRHRRSEPPQPLPGHRPIVTGSGLRPDPDPDLRP